MTCGRGRSDFVRAVREELENLTASEVHIKRFRHQEVSHEETFPYADGTLNLFDFPRLHRGEKPAEGNLLQDEGDYEEETILEQRTEMIIEAKVFHLPSSRSTSINIVRREEEETCPTSVKHVNVMRQRTSMDNASQHTWNDHWNEESDVALSGEWVGTTGFQIMRTELPERTLTVNGRRTQSATYHTTRHSRARHSQDYQRNKRMKTSQTGMKEKTTLQESRRKRGFFEISPEAKDCSTNAWFWQCCGFPRRSARGTEAPSSGRFLSWPIFHLLANFRSTHHPRTPRTPRTPPHHTTTPHHPTTLLSTTPHTNAARREPDGWRPAGWGAEGWGHEGGGPEISRFFPSPAPIFAFFCSYW